MTNELIRRRDLDFLVYEWLGGEGLFERPRFQAHSRETADAILDLSAELAAAEFLPHYKAGDQHEPKLGPDGVEVLPQIGEALHSYAEAGLFAAGFPEEEGGVGLPFLFCQAAFASFAAANLATAAYAMLTAANARLICAFGSDEQRRVFATPQIEGRWWGTMCLSEPQAGSSLADITTRATPDGEDALGGRYRLAGNKMWISGGDQNLSENIVHLVLAKIPEDGGALPTGSKGISLFIVPKLLPDGAPNDVSVAGLNHKMGYRGTANCLLNFGERGGAVGWIVGAPGEGLRQMFMMMNEARISVGLGAAAAAYRGYQLALRYAQERRQGRVNGSSTPSLIIEHADVKRMLLTQKAYSEGALALCLLAARLVDEEDADSAELLGLLTPVVKTWSSEYGLISNDLAIQVHGGYGYTRDFDVEQLYRDNRLNPIHEGATGIQALDLVGRKIMKSDGRAMAILAVRVEETAAAARRSGLETYADGLEAAWAMIAASVDRFADDPAAALVNATPFLSALGHLVVGWIWLDLAVLASAPKAAEDDFYAGKRRACAHYFESELPKIGVWLSQVDARSPTVADAPISQF